MPVLKVKVKCWRCGKNVDKSDTVETNLQNKDRRHQCYSCYKKNKSLCWGFGDKIKVKKEWFCERCKYKFKAANTTCPYCNRSDYVTKARVFAAELI
jgi:hypothetical protein